ncbi:MAG: alpha/beta hydrolase family protein [Rubrivivax sp.]
MPTAPAPAEPRRRMLLAGSSLAAALAACSTPLPPLTPSTPTPRLEHRVRGSGQPLVVLQSGLGDGLSVWGDVQASLPTTLASVAFSRPGYGGSARADGARSPCDVAKLTREFLRGARLPPPYLLVGHSLGGLYQVAFAQRYPDEVAGLVLLDPTHPAHWATMQTETPALAAVVRAARVTAFSAPMRREFDDQALCNSELAAWRLPAVPVRLLVRERFTGLEAGAFERAVRRLEADWSQRLGGVEATRVAGAGHYLQRDRPRVVSEAISAVAALAVAAGTGAPRQRARGDARDAAGGDARDAARGDAPVGTGDDARGGTRAHNHRQAARADGARGRAVT